MPYNKEYILSKLRLLALVTFALSLPYSIPINNVAVILLALCWIFESSLKEKLGRIRINSLVFGYILFYLLHVVGLLYSENMHQGLFELEKKISFVLLPLILASSNPISKDDIKLFFKSFIVACTIGTIVCFVYAIKRNIDEGHTFEYVFNAIVFDKHIPGRYYYFNYWYFTYELFAAGIDLHPIYFAMYLLFSSCLVIWLWWDQSADKRMSWKIVLLLVYYFIVIILLSSRMQLFLSLVLGIGFIIYYSKYHNRLIRGFTFIFGVLILGFILIYFNPLAWERFVVSNLPSSHFSENKFGEGGLSLRKYKWAYTLEAISNSPVIGEGTGDSQDQLQLVYKKNDFKIGYENYFDPHNQYLQTTLQLGLIGLLALCACLFLPTYSAFTNHKPLYLTFIFLFAISCLTESMLSVHKGIVFYSMFNSMFAFHMLKAKLDGD